MKKFLFATFMGALVALVGCQQDDELTGVENTLGKKVSVTANIKANAQSRVAMEYVTGADGGSLIKVDWKDSGESFLMCDPTNPTLPPTTFTQTSGNQFEGTLPSESGTYIAVYGNGQNLLSQNGTLNEDYVWMTDREVADLTEPIEFKHQTTVLKPNFIIENKNVNAAITKIVMDGVPLLGDAEAITITPSQGDNTITPSQVNDIFIFLPVMMGEAIEQGTTFNFTVTKDGKDYVAELSISKSMEVGKFYTAAIELEEKPIPYVTFTAGAEQTLKYTGNDLEYSLDGTTFQDLAPNTEISFREGVKLYLRNKGDDNLDGTIGENYNNISFGTEARVACEGDIRTLIDYDNYENVSTNQADFRHLFYGCVQLTSAPALPSTDLAAGCYKNMFLGCTSLTEAPELPATTLTNYCYSGMFNGCTSLTEAPELPATTLTEECYSWMFQDCSSLEVAPELPATDLAKACYLGMFYSCDNLVTAPALPATDLAVGCYKKMFNSCTSLESITMLATNISATDCLTDWVNGVTGIGTFTKASSMTSLPTGASGIPTGWQVVNQ